MCETKLNFTELSLYSLAVEFRVKKGMNSGELFDALTGKNVPFNLS